MMQEKIKAAFVSQFRPIAIRFFKIVGGFQIGLGTAGIIAAIIDANASEKITYTIQEPVLSSTGKITGYKPKEYSTDYKHKWTTTHTIFSFLSLGLIIPGFVLVSF